MKIYLDVHYNSNSDDKEWISNLFNILDFNQDGMMEVYEFMTSINYIMNFKDQTKILDLE
jgi:Ca2+-binding EF-hand superfamily protein